MTTVPNKRLASTDFVKIPATAASEPNVFSKAIDLCADVLKEWLEILRLSVFQLAAKEMKTARILTSADKEIASNPACSKTPAVPMPSATLSPTSPTADAWRALKETPIKAALRSAAAWIQNARTERLATTASVSTRADKKILVTPSRNAFPKITLLSVAV